MPARPILPDRQDVGELLRWLGDGNFLLGLPTVPGG